jgi:predicted amidohydrolase
MVTRCLENNVYAITANRTGREERSGKNLSYTGKSQITSPDARILHQADGQKDEIGIVGINVQVARNKKINNYNDVLADRRVEHYQDLVKAVPGDPSVITKIFFCMLKIIFFWLLNENTFFT